MKSLGAISFLNRPEFWAFRSNGLGLTRITNIRELVRLRTSFKVRLWTQADI
mgnify:CR=1 FL=1